MKYITEVTKDTLYLKDKQGNELEQCELTGNESMEDIKDLSNMLINEYEDR